jgi:acyl-CoA synthetase (AMP-forming)/AMP-acid ligase II
VTHPGTHARATPGKPAIVMGRSGDVVTYAELDARSNRLAQFFRSIGLAARDHIAILVENQPRFLELCWAAQRAGLYYTPVNTHLAAEEAAYIVNDCGARVLLAGSALAELATALVAKTPRVAHRLMLGAMAPGHERYEDVVARHPAEPIADEREGAPMLYSSGTTGRPKGVVPPRLGVPLGTPPVVHELNRRLYGFDPDSVYLSPAPLYHSAPLNYCMMMHRLGGTAVVMERFDAREALRLIERHRVTHAQWVPTMFVRMLQLPPEERARFDLSSQRAAIHAAAPCPIPVKEAMIAWWGPILYEYYSATERPGMTWLAPADWPAHKGSVGRAVLGELHIVGENDEEVPPGEVGTVYFAGGPKFEYHNDPGATADSRNPRGWTTVGDLGYVDRDGFLYLTDRKGFMIISGGVNIYPQEIENVLASHPKVQDVAVVGVPNEEFGEEVKAVVQATDPTSAGPELANELIAWCRTHLAHYKCPRSIDFEAALPRLPTGKLHKQPLRARYWPTPAGQR